MVLVSKGHDNAVTASIIILHLNQLSSDYRNKLELFINHAGLVL